MEENNKFISFDGVLGRRNFIINYFIVVAAINLIFSTPSVIYILFHPEVLNGTGSLFFTAWLMLSGIVSAALLYPSVVRRVRDIFPEQSENSIYIYSSLILLIMVFTSVPVLEQMLIFQWLNIALILMLMCLHGTTTRMPQSEIIKFNWGAFFGTWIWGLFNKTPITLLMIPLCFTTASLPFALICGLKGNEWAYKNKHLEDIEDFHKSQKKQAVIWTILSPVIYIIFAVILFLTLGMVINSYSNAHPDFMGNIESISKNYQQYTASSYFSEIKKSGNEYQFYIDPKVWSKMSNSTKISVFNMAEEYAETQEQQNSQNQKPQDILKSLSNVKIYSTFNNELLGEYSASDEMFSKILSDKNSKNWRKIAQFMKAAKEGYKFNNHPSLP